MQHATTITVPATPRQVWATMSAVRDWPSWLSTVDDVSPVRPEEPDGIGARYQVRQPKLATATWEVTRWEPAAGFAWRSVRPGVVSVGNHTIEDLGGSSRISLGMEWTGALAPLVNLVYGRLTQRYLETEAASLVQRAGTAR